MGVDACSAAPAGRQRSRAGVGVLTDGSAERDAKKKTPNGSEPFELCNLMFDFPLDNSAVGQFFKFFFVSVAVND